MTQLQSELNRHPDATVVFHDKYTAMETASYERLEELAELVPAGPRVFAGVSEPPRRHVPDGVCGTPPVGFVASRQATARCKLDAAVEAGDTSGVRQGGRLADAAQGCFGVVDEADDDDEP